LNNIARDQRRTAKAWKKRGVTNVRGLHANTKKHTNLGGDRGGCTGAIVGIIMIGGTIVGGVLTVKGLT
jgi:hypothetical protein